MIIDDRQLSEVGWFSESKLHNISWVTRVGVIVIWHHRWGYFQYQSWIIFRNGKIVSLTEVVRVEIIVSLTVILYRLGLQCQSEGYTVYVGSSMPELTLHWAIQWSEQVIDTLSQNLYYTTWICFSYLPIILTIFMPTHPYIKPHYETLLTQWNWDLGADATIMVNVIVV